ncbi:MAG: YgfZ/GcvT domain-containing protein, partial [Rhodanobacter sp.]
MPSIPCPADILLLDGPDALAFAQSQFSSNLLPLTPGHWQFSGWLDAQGRVRALFHLARVDEQRLLLLLRGGSASSMRDALQRFVFRSKLRLELPTPAILTTGAAQALHTLSREGDTYSLGCGNHSLQITPS